MCSESRTVERLETKLSHSEAEICRKNDIISELADRNASLELDLREAVDTVHKLIDS